MLLIMRVVRFFHQWASYQTLNALLLYLEAPRSLETTEFRMELLGHCD